jgi:phospholipid transport system transporter-binding protein
MTATVEARDGSLRVSGDMTLETANALFARGLEISKNQSQPPVFDLAGVDEVDSSGLAVLFGWMRAAEAQGKILRIDNPPANLVSLAQVYDVSDLLPLS